MSDLVLWIITVVSFAFGAFYSGSETAFLAADRIRMRHLAASGNRRARAALDLIARPEYFLSAVLVGTNLSITACTAAFTALATRHYGENGPTIATAILVPAVLLFNEIVPKGLFLHYANRAVIVTIDTLRVLTAILSPIVRFFSSLTNAVTRAMPAAPESDSTRMTMEELLFHLEDSREAGLIAPETATLADRAIALQGLVTKDVMHALDSVEMLDRTATRRSYGEVFTRTGYSRLPVYAGTRDNVVAVLSAHEYVTSRDREALVESLPAPYTVLEDTRIVDLLFEMREKGRHMAIVADASGKAVGMVTLEDILERFVGAIADEFN